VSFSCFSEAGKKSRLDLQQSQISQQKQRRRTTVRRRCFYPKIGAISQVLTRESKAKNTPILRGGLKKDQQSI
jgi:hypothetical protein